MQVDVLGCRGSTPTPGVEFSRYGGETSCVAVSGDDGVPRLVLDAGTGIRHLPRLLDGRAFEGSILLSHLHWDHTQGLPFCSSVDRDDAVVDLHLPAQDFDAAALLGRAMGPPHFPIGPTELRGEWRFFGIEEGRHRLDGFDVLAREIPHKGGRTFGYRVSDGVGSAAYLPDHHPGPPGSGPSGLGELHPAALELADEVDLLIHDAQYTAAEYPDRHGYGHASAEYAIELGRAGGAHALLLFHHDPTRTDDELDALVASLTGPHGWPAGVERAWKPTIRIAVQGESICV